MLPVILVAVGAYLIGDSVLGDKKSYADGGMMAKGGKIAVRNEGVDEVSLTGKKRYGVEIQDEESGDVLDYQYFDSEKEAYKFISSYKKNKTELPLTEFDKRMIAYIERDDERDSLYDSSEYAYMADGGVMDVVNTEVIKVKGNIMGTTSLELKIKGMRKPQDFIVYPISTEQAGKPITIQSDTRFGYLDLSSGRGLMSQSHANGAYSYHFSMDKKVPFKISETDVQKIKEHLASKASSKAGNSVIFSDNSGADKMAKGGNIYRRQSIKSFYVDTYPTDNLGQEINGEASFEGLNKVLDCNIDVYEYLGVGDSLVRERVFSKLAELMGVSYDVIYDKWLKSDYAKGGKLVGKQKNLDVNKNGKLDAEDFKMLRGEKMENGGKLYDEMYGVGKSKYVVKTHDGVKKHQDGSPFYDIEIFKNKIKKNKYISDLKEKGYKKRTF
jgi:hypothetical protein